jgi:hypothetical protein
MLYFVTVRKYNHCHFTYLNIIVHIKNPIVFCALLIFNPKHLDFFLKCPNTSFCYLGINYNTSITPNFLCD